ncbi:hypothetical protein LTR27_010457 [Elasticomyces elasticus]|nr:hypothetical protein LTR27_010457 [Elasticomyces elasticus]
MTNEAYMPRLLLLPAELRNSILSSALIRAGPVVAYIEYSLMPSRDNSRRFVQCRRARLGLPGVFGACRQLREESTAIYFGNNTFSFVMVSDKPPAPRSCFLLRGNRFTKYLRHIVITFNVDIPEPTPFGPRYGATGAKLELRISAEGQLLRSAAVPKSPDWRRTCGERRGRFMARTRGTLDISLARAAAYLELLTLPPYTGLERWPARICDRCDKPRENTFFLDNSEGIYPS